MVFESLIARLRGMANGDSKLYLTRTMENLYLYSPQGKSILTAAEPAVLAGKAFDGGYQQGLILRVGYDDAPAGLKQALAAAGVKPERVSIPSRKDLTGVVSAIGIRIANAKAKSSVKAAAQAEKTGVAKI